MKKIIVAHPYKQHSFQLAKALDKNGYLFSYITTVYDKDGSLMGIAKKLLKGDNLKRASGRKCNDISDDKVQLFCELRGYFALLVARFCPKSFTIRMQQYIYNCFGKKVAKYAIKNKVDAVIMFDPTATACFEYLKRKAPQIKLILDMPGVSRISLKRLYENELNNGTEILTKPDLYIFKDKQIEDTAKELMNADYFITASDYVRNTLIDDGAPSDKIVVIPYGIDSTKFIRTKADKRPDKLVVVYVGRISYLKGIHYLIKSVKEIDPNKIELHLYGEDRMDGDLQNMINGFPNIYVHGFVTSDKLPDIYSSADIFAFPSLTDGFGFVVLEALSCELPVLCSNSAGVCKAIVDGVNGFRFNASDYARLKDLLDWCVNNKGILREMGKSGRREALKYTWETYGVKLNEFIDKIYGEI